MKTEFFPLSKKQLSEVKGGNVYYCTVITNPGPQPSSPELEPLGPSYLIEANSATEAADIAHALYGGDQVNCTLY